MNCKKIELAKGLYLVATPIGNARDITLRALDILLCADVLAAEDTRTLRRLMNIHGIPILDRPVISYHDHSTIRVRNKLLDYLRSGKSVAYTSEAGTPLVADPGYKLLKFAIEDGQFVTAVPGPAALLPALTLAGLPTDSFYFDGFLPSGKSARRARLEKLSGTRATLIFYESSKRIAAMLQDACDVLGADRQAAYCRELTKKFEEVQRGSLQDLRDIVENKDVKGECVVLVGEAVQRKFNDDDVLSAIQDALKLMSMRDASQIVAETFGLPRREIYQKALNFTKKIDSKDF